MPASNSCYKNALFCIVLFSVGLRVRKWRPGVAHERLVRVGQAGGDVGGCQAGRRHDDDDDNQVPCFFLFSLSNPSRPPH